MLRAIRRLIGFALMVAGLAAGAFAWFAYSPMSLPAGGTTLAVKQGATLRTVGRQLEDLGAVPDDRLFWWLARVTQVSFVLKPGIYKLPNGLTPDALLTKLATGKPEIAEIQFVEGSRFRDLRAQIAARQDLKPDSRSLKDGELLQTIGATEAHPEGLFFPDKYQIEPGASELEFYRRAYRAMQTRLAEAWAQRQVGVPLASPYELLIMASIVEKETGAGEERARIAGVFYNRIRANMRLQTDPTVIYGMGDAFDGNLRRRDLTTDTPWNTYTREGLPPTPIAMPGLAALLAAAQPEASGFYYFVARGDGTHYFSKSLDEHNRAVQKYQRGG
jgi:UPF0755 protein